MAAVEQLPAAQERLPRSRSARLADQAATAALYVTHPERRFSVREPVTTESDLETLKATGSRPGFSYASALAALSHAKQRGHGVTTTTAFYTADRRAAELPSHEGYQAAICAVRDRRAVSNLAPVSTSLKNEIAMGQVPDSRRRVSQRGGAISAATGAYSNRRRADSAPSNAPYAGTGTELSIDPLDDIDSSIEASRIQHLAHANARMYTSSPPISTEIEEHRRKSILQAATISMAKEVYGVVETKEGGVQGSAASATQRGHTRARSQRALSKPDQAILQQAVSLQDIAQKRAAEKLASMDDETVIYREYYGVGGEQQPTRSSFTIRKRRGSNETEASGFDAERSREIRTQMTTLRSRLNAVDEQRERDRETLLQAARKNVDAALQDMEMRVYAETGRAPASMQKELEETAMERVLQGKRGVDAEYPMADKVNIGSQRYVDMADVEAIARSRLQPTFDEINELAETQRAKELEERLDAEERERQKAIERQREADIKMEEKRHKAQMKLEGRSKEDKTWLWRRKSKRASSTNEPTVAEEATEVPTEHEQNMVAEPEAAEALPEDTTQNQPTDATDAIATGGVAEEEAQMEPATRQESKLKSWFKDRLRRRSSVAAAEESKAEEGAAEADGVETSAPEEAQESNVAGTVGQTGKTRGVSEVPKEVGEMEDSAVERSKIAKHEGTAQVSEERASEGNSQAAALRSHPITADDLGAMKNGAPLDNSADNVSGMTPSEYLAIEQGSKDKVEHHADLKRNRLKEGIKKIVSRSSGDAKSNETASPAEEGQEVTETTEKNATTSHEEPSPGTERETLRESAAEQGLAAPPNIGKRGTSRESRFSEDL